MFVYLLDQSCADPFWIQASRFFFAAFLPLLAFVFSFVVSRFIPWIKTGPFPAPVFSIGLPVAMVASSMLFSVALSGRFQSLKESLRKSAEHSRAIRAAAEESLREEKSRINRELHDVIGSDLSALIFDLQRRHEDPGLTGRLGSMLSRLRDLVHLNSLEADFNLAGEMHSFAQALQGDDPNIEVRAANVEMPVVTAFHLHRIFLEAVTNSLRHAAPKHIQVRLERRAQSVLLSIADDGQGFRKGVSAGSGLAGIRERCGRIGASLRILSARNRGTIVAVFVPGAVSPP